jgi:3-oxoadipate enol-lactonase
MPLIWLPDIRLNTMLDGPADGTPLVLLHALGLDLTLWDDLVPRLAGLRILRIDMRGHGLSDTPAPPYPMGALIRDVAAAMDHHGMSRAVVLGLSVGGLVAQGLAVRRPDLVRALVLSNTAARIGTPEIWAARIAEVRQGGMAAIAGPTLDRWFGPGADRPDWRARLLAARPAGWIGAAGAIAGADFRATTPALRVPALVIAGDRDGSTPPDLVRDLADMIPGSRHLLIRGAGHLPSVDKPVDYARALCGFISDLGPL